MLGGELGAHNGNQRGGGVGGVVHALGDDGDGGHRQTDDHLDGRKNQIHQYVQTGNGNHRSLPAVRLLPQKFVQKFHYFAPF